MDKTREDREKGVKSAPEGAKYGQVTVAAPITDTRAECRPDQHPGEVTNEGKTR